MPALFLYLPKFRKAGANDHDQTGKTSFTIDECYMMMFSEYEDAASMLRLPVKRVPFNLPAGTKNVSEMAPTESNDRILPITDLTKPFIFPPYKT